MQDEFKPINDEMEDNQPYKRFGPVAKSLITIGFLLFIGAGIYFAIQFYQNWKEENVLTVEKVEQQMNIDETTYEDYLFNFKRAGIEEPIAEYVYNVKIEETRRKEIDPMFNDSYIGYFENEDINGALWEVEDGYLHFLYYPDTKEVISLVQWDDDYELGLQIKKKKGEKALLTKEAIDEKNVNERNEIIKNIEELNNNLMELFNEMNNNLGH